MSDKKIKLLLVDDDDVIREAYVQIFQQKGLEVTAAKDGLEGLDLATKNIPDVIMTGIIMPRMDGFQLIKALRENVPTKDVPIAILSHLGREEDRQKASELGVNNFIVQGTIPPNEIVSMIRGLVSAGNVFKLSFDPYAWDAPRLAKTLPGESFTCPECQEKMILEITPKQEGGGFTGIIKCPKCEHAL